MIIGMFNNWENPEKDSGTAVENACLTFRLKGGLATSLGLFRTGCVRNRTSKNNARHRHRRVTALAKFPIFLRQPRTRFHWATLMSQTGMLGPVDDAKYPPDYPLHSPLLQFVARLGACTTDSDSARRNANTRWNHKVSCGEGDFRTQTSRVQYSLLDTKMSQSILFRNNIYFWIYTYFILNK